MISRLLSAETTIHSNVASHTPLPRWVTNCRAILWVARRLYPRIVAALFVMSATTTAATTRARAATVPTAVTSRFQSWILFSLADIFAGDGLRGGGGLRDGGVRPWKGWPLLAYRDRAAHGSTLVRIRHRNRNRCTGVRRLSRRHVRRRHRLWVLSPSGLLQLNGGCGCNCCHKK